MINRYGAYLFGGDKIIINKVRTFSSSFEFYEKRTFHACETVKAFLNINFIKTDLIE